MPLLNVSGLLALLRVRLTLLVLLAVVPAWGLMLYTAGQQRRMASEAVQQDALRLAHTVAAGQDRLIEGARQVLTTLAQIPAVRAPNAKQCSALLAELLKQFPNYANFGVIAPDGDIWCSALPLRAPVNAADRAYFRGAMQMRDFAIGEYQIGRITRKATVNFGYPILDEAGRVRAVVFAALDLAWLNSFARSTELPPGAALMVSDRKGVILVRHPDPQSLVGKKLPASLIRAMETRGGDGTVETKGADGVLRVYGFTPLPSAPGLNAFLAIGVPKDVAVAETEKVFRRSLTVLAMVALLALGAAWMGGNYFILRKVRSLVSATQRIAGGDLSTRTRMAGAGELNQLGQAFDGMALALQQREAEAGRYAEEIKLLQSMTMAISTAPDLHAALAIALQKICQTTGWDIGQAWTSSPSGSELVCSPGWYAKTPELQSFRNASLTFTFAPGKGLPGRAWSSKAPLWLQDVTHDSNFPRAPFAAGVGIKAALAVPVLVHDEVLAVMEFFMLESRAEDERLVRLVSALASQLGEVIQRKLTEDRMRQLAFTDTLTGLPNRTQLHELLQHAIEEAQRTGHPLALLAVSLERFKEINYTLGQANGDLLLRQIGPRIRAALREPDTLAYLGGREFGVLLPGGGAHAAGEAASRIVKNFEQPFEIAGFTVEVGANIGIACFPGHGKEAVVLARHAEVALYKAQRDGSSYSMYKAEDDPYNPRRLQLMGELRSAIAERQLTLYCQPKLDLKTRQIASMESLMRWQHPSYGLVAPDAFVPFIESTGLIGPLTEWVLDAALIQCHAWRQSDIRIPVAVNLSTRNLADPRIVDYIESAMVTWGAEPSWIDLEITEGAIMVDPEASLETLRRLDAMGFRLFIDDFGTGYSSLAYLQKLPVSAIKIDKSFVLPLLKDKDAAMIVRSAIQLGHNLGLKVIAEGVESEEICERLIAMDCDEAQGFYVSPPIPMGQFAEWVQGSGWSLKVAEAPRVEELPIRPDPPVAG